MMTKPVETHFAEMFIDGAMMLAREGARITKIHMPTRDFLWLAYQLNADDPGADPRIVLRPRHRGLTTDWVNSQPLEKIFDPLVRVGDRFQMAVPWGMVEVIEDKDAE